MSITSYSVSVVKKIVWLALTMSVVACALLFASRSLSHNRQSANDVETKDLAPVQRHTLMESEVITVTRRGFEPARISRPVGRFILMVDNRSDMNLNFRLARDTGQPLTEIASSQLPKSIRAVLTIRLANIRQLHELELEPRTSIDSSTYPPRSLGCSTCGYVKWDIPEPIIIMESSIPDDVDIFRDCLGTTLILATDWFVEAVQRLEFTGLEFRELQTT